MVNRLEKSKNQTTIFLWNINYSRHGFLPRNNNL